MTTVTREEKRMKDEEEVIRKVLELGMSSEVKIEVKDDRETEMTFYAGDRKIATFKVHTKTLFYLKPPRTLEETTALTVITGKFHRIPEIEVEKVIAGMLSENDLKRWSLLIGKIVGIVRGREEEAKMALAHFKAVANRIGTSEVNESANKVFSLLTVALKMLQE